MLLVAACAPRCPAGQKLVNGQCLRMTTTESGSVAAAGATSTGDARQQSASTADDQDDAPNIGKQAAAGSGARAPSQMPAGRGGNQASRANSAAGSGTGTAGAGDASSQAAGICAGQADSAVCDGAVLHHCDSAGSDSAPETCMNEALCQVGAASGACAQCTPGTYSCDGVALQLCSDAGQWEESERCASAALCNDMVGACTEMVCQPGKKTCDASGTLQTCNADGSAIDSEEPCGMGLCDAQHGRCNACVPNAKMCNGDTAVTCSSDGQTMNEMECTAPAGDCATSKCQAGRCVPGTKRAGEACTAGGGKICNAMGRCVGCVQKTDCPGKFDMCTAGECVPGPGCGNGEIDPGEVCETAGPNAYAPGTCDASKCRLMDAAYGACRPQGACPNGTQGWFCGASNACSHVCTSDDQCITSSGKGACVSIGANDPMKYCVIRCSGSCPNGLTCMDYSGIAPGIGSLCGTP